MTLAYVLYEENEDTQAAIEMARETVAAGLRPRSNTSGSNRRREAPPASQATSTHLSVPEITVHNVSMRLREKDKKFSGDLSVSCMEYMDDYFELSRYCSLKPSQKLQYLHNLLQGDAKRYFLDKIDGYGTSFQHAIEMLERENNPPVRKDRDKNYLNSLRVTTFVAQGIEISEALSKVYRSFIKLSGQAPRSHQGDALKVDVLRNAVVRTPYSSEPLSRVTTHQLTF